MAASAPSPLPKPSFRSTFEGRDKALVPKSIASLGVTLGTGVAIGYILTTTAPFWWTAPALSLTLLLPPLFRQLKLLSGIEKDPLEQRVVRGRFSARMPKDKSFVVFLIGARVNDPCDLTKLDSFYQWMGKAFDNMDRELEALGPELGYLGGEGYVSMSRTGTLTVQYWESMEKLQAWARGRQYAHNKPWKVLQAKGKDTPRYAFWHEAYQVGADGSYETIYVNCPPLGLANAKGSELFTCQGQMATAAGRTGASDGKDWPDEFDKSQH
ncbi:unnamed protein product [Pedinophyceae sp. YPF-701]|nr:unnamed protein product [Pedinophyceae sp. YPF-701]